MSTNPRIETLPIDIHYPEASPGIYRLLVDGISEYAIFLMDPVGNISSWNAGAERIKGYRADEVLGKHFSIFFSDEDVKNGKCEFELEQAKKFGRFEEEAWRLRKGGERIWTNVTIDRLNNSDGDLVGYSKITKDLTERLKAQNEINKANEKASLYRSALDESAAVFFTDKQGLITHVNDFFCHLSGYERQELLGTHQEDLNSGHHSEDFSAAKLKQVASGKPWRGEICSRSKTGGLYWVDTTISPQMAADGTVDQFLTIQFDISQKKKSEFLLLQSAKMASLGEMAGGIAHEMNNPLAIIQANAEFLGRLASLDKLDTPKFREITGIISDTVQRAGKIITGLRAFAREGTQDPFVKMSVSDLINETLNFCRSRFESRGIPITLGQVNLDWQIQCRQVQLSQVVLNLLNNAYDAIEGSLDPFVKITIESPSDGFIEISVVDSGKGIPKEIAEQIMQPFFTTKKVGKGTGLGLSISTSIVQSHNGELFFDNTSKNSRFVIKLPRSPGGDRVQHA